MDDESEDSKETADNNVPDPMTRQLEAEVCNDLVSFMMTEVFYSIQRLLAADFKVLYYGEGVNAHKINPNPLQEDFACTPDSRKGGVRLTPNITYDWYACGIFSLFG